MLGTLIVKVNTSNKINEFETRKAANVAEVNIS
jgi:hypothetical protein